MHKKHMNPGTQWLNPQTANEETISTAQQQDRIVDGQHYISLPTSCISVILDKDSVSESNHQHEHLVVETRGSSPSEGALSSPQEYLIPQLFREDGDTKEETFTATTSAVLDTGYSPLFTRVWALLCFCALWILVIISLQVTYSISQAQYGLATTNKSLRYLWTYGPTAFLVVVTVLWRQVESAVKYIQPWAGLASGLLPASHTLLLDYISPLQVVVLWRALRLRHFAVSSTVLVSIFIKVSTVVSTGLFALNSIQFDHIPQKMLVLTSFNSSRGLPLDRIDSTAATVLQGSTMYGLMLPDGTTPDYAFQRFQPDSATSDDMITYNASIEVFVPTVSDCQSGFLTYVNSTDHDVVGDGTDIWEVASQMTYYNTSITLPDCVVHNGHLDTPTTFWDSRQNDTTPRYGLYSIWQIVNCSNLQPSDPGFYRYTVSTAYSKALNYTNNIMLNSSNVVCIPSYYIQNGFVSMSMNGTLNGDIVLSGPKRQLDNIDANDISLAVQASLRQAVITTGETDYPAATTDFINEMISLTPDFNVTMLMDSDWLSAKSQIVHRQLAVQVANQYLLVQNTQPTTTQGYITRTEQRLTMRTLPTRILQVLSAMMLLLTGIALFTVPRRVVPRTVGSIGATAVILARSPSLRLLLQGTGHLNMDQLKDVLDGNYFTSALHNGPNGRIFSISVSTRSEILTSKTPKTIVKQVKWVYPLLLRRVMIVLVLSLATTVLLALQVLYQQSNAHDGIANVNPESLQRYTWLYIPTLVLVLLATAFNSIDFELRSIDPYHELARDPANAASSFLWDPLSSSAVSIGIRALRRSKYFLVSSSIAVMIAPILTIVVSGLFVPAMVLRAYDVSVTPVTWFNTSLIGLYGSSLSIPGLILQSNMSYPKWTHNELAYPSFDLPSDIENGRSVTLDLPAVRAFANCTIVPPSEVTVYPFGINGDEDPKGNLYFNYNTSVPERCGTEGTMGNPPVHYSKMVSLPTTGPLYFGVVAGSGGWVSNGYNNGSVLCPTAYLYGNADAVARTYANISLLVCYSGLETVQTKTDFNMDLVSMATEPKIEADSAQVFIENYWPVSGGVPYFPPVNFSHVDEAFDDYTNVMVYGKDGVPRDELLKPNALLAQFEHTYKQWVAQWVNINLRNPVTTLAANLSLVAGELPGPLTGVYHATNTQRLFVDEVSTRILQGIIATLVVCGIVILLTVDLVGVLPKPLGTIGVVASLLADSRLVNDKNGLIPAGSEWQSDRILRGQPPWHGGKFRMGWWKVDRGEGVLESGMIETVYKASGKHLSLKSSSEVEKERFMIDIY